jgi:hypothetical protein
VPTVAGHEFVSSGQFTVRMEEICRECGSLKPARVHDEPAGEKPSAEAAAEYERRGWR